jgi:hypothetical protein
LGQAERNVQCFGLVFDFDLRDMSNELIDVVLDGDFLNEKLRP